MVAPSLRFLMMLFAALAGCWIGPGNWSDWEDKHGTFDTDQVEGDTDTDADGDSDSDADTGLSDADGDGFTIDDGDCDDHNPSVNPGEDEVCLDGLDNDCDDSTDVCSLSGVENKILADGASESVGQHLALAGDVNADGLEDILVGNTANAAAGSGGRG